MLHEYRKKTTIKAEQFDGSDEMAEKYGLKKFGWEGFVRTLNSLDNFGFGAPLVFSKDDWFIEGDNARLMSCQIKNSAGPMRGATDEQV